MSTQARLFVVFVCLSFAAIVPVSAQWLDWCDPTTVYTCGSWATEDCPNGGNCDSVVIGNSCLPAWIGACAPTDCDGFCHDNSTEACWSFVRQYC